MATFITRSERVSRIEWERRFAYLDTPSAGFAFASDELGNVDFAAMGPARLASFNFCLAETGNTMTDLGAISRTWNELVPAVIRCHCGAAVTLWADAEECARCHRLYNLSGQELAPRSQWGEETGETYSDIVNGYDPERMPGEPYYDVDGEV